MKKLLKTIFKILGYTLLAIVLLLILFIAYCIWNFSSDDKSTITNPEEYNKCIESVQNSDKIAHFPKNITDTDNANLYCHPGHYKGDGELVILKLKSNKIFIEKELKSHSFLNSNEPIGTKQNIYYMPTEKVGIPNEDLTFYILKNEDNKYYYKQYFPYFTGIGIDKNLENIVYYYIEPSD